MIKTYTFEITTQRPQIMQPITKEIKQCLKQASIQNGHITVFIPHTTAAVTINENADPDVEGDMIMGIDAAFPDRKAFKHMEGNSHAHIKSSVIGVEQTILIEAQTMLLGTWQGIYFCEFDGPRTRKVHVQITGE